MTSPSPIWSRLRAWLELFRLPNLFTLPGDILAGMALVLTSGAATPSPSRVAAAILGSLALYGLGLILNDLADLGEDRRDRPGRPLPSGRISSRAALGAGLTLAFLAWAPALSAGRAPAIATGVLLVAILLYTYGRRVLPVPISALLMGLCRGLNLLLGAAYALPDWDFVVPAPLAAAVAGSTLYITAVVLLARHETEPDRHLPAPLRFGPAAAMALAVAGVVAMARSALAASDLAGVGAVGACIVGAAWMECRRTRRGPLPLLIGRLVHLIVPWQAFLLLVAGQHVPALAVLVFWYLARILSIRFAPS